MSSSSISKHSSRTAARHPPEHADEEGDILVTLKREHAQIRALLERLQHADAAVERKFLVRQVKTTLLPHIRAEEKVVYAALVALKDAHARQDGHEGYLEHEWAAKTLQRLEKIRDCNSAQHRAAAKVLRELVVHHLREEEHAVWNDIKQHFDEAARVALNREYQAARDRVRAH